MHLDHLVQAVAAGRLEAKCDPLAFFLVQLVVENLIARGLADAEARVPLDGLGAYIQAA
ncbi:hypothetical protein D3C87_1868180 [compost metagenome]